ncbi:MAG: dUTP diphosphatase [Bryobacterales bacterium]|nr:dUTP diphosphatase [Bryobacterales bacterium]
MDSEISIAIKRMPGTDDLALPAYQSDNASGMDVRAAVQSLVRLEPGQRAVIPAGFAIEVPRGYEAQLRPRSGLAAKHGVTVLNSPGTIDSDYRGEVAVVVINLGNEAFEISRGLRIAQIVIAPVSRVQWNEVQDLSPTRRDAGGFGHSGE